MKSAVVTGCTGLIGRALIKELVSQGIEVLALVRKSEKAIEISNLGAKIIYCNLDSFKDLNISGKYDGFYHLAWSGTRGASRLDEIEQQKNVAYTLDAVRLAKRLGCEFFVGVGSQAEYGKVPNGTKLSPQTPENPESAYGKAKLMARNESQKLCGELGIRHNWCRVLSAYGIGDYENTLVMHAIREFGAGNKCDFTPCEQQWDYLFSADLANGLYLIGDKGKSNATYVIGSGDVKPLKYYIDTIFEAVGNNDASCNFGAVDYYPDQVMYLCADISDLQRDTGFQPKTEFSQGIRAILDWQKTQKKD